MSGEQFGASPSENGEEHVDAEYPDQEFGEPWDANDEYTPSSFSDLFGTAMARPGNTPSRAVEQMLRAMTMTQPLAPGGSDLEKRQRLWTALFGDSGLGGDVIGPFELQLPSKWSQDQHVSPSDLAAVNRILASLGLRLGTNPGADSVTLGFDDDNDTENLGSRFDLLWYWEYLRSWVRSTHQEGLYRHIEMAIGEDIYGIDLRCSWLMFG